MTREERHPTTQSLQRTQRISENDLRRERERIRSDEAQDEGNILPADQERLNAARRKLFTYRQSVIIDDEPDSKQDDDNDAAQSASDEYATAESQVGGKEPDHPQNHDGQGNEEHNNNAGVHFWGCLLYTSPSPRDLSTSRMPSSA